MIVLDASAAAELLLERSRAAAWVADTIVGAELVHAPHLIDAEVASVLRRRTLSGELPAARGEDALVRLSELRMVRYPIAPMFARIWALRESLTAFDATYVALAEALRLPLVTTDVRLARAPGHRAEIITYRA